MATGSYLTPNYSRSQIAVKSLTIPKRGNNKKKKSLNSRVDGPLKGTINPLSPPLQFQSPPFPPCPDHHPVSSIPPPSQLESSPVVRTVIPNLGRRPHRWDMAIFWWGMGWTCTLRLTIAKTMGALLVEWQRQQQNCRIWSEANPQVYVETPLHPEKLTVWCALWAGGILLQKR
ncbi:hypothetical protein TNCV_1315881 [Trichonephila clavipes]|uniref:Uncharacterized protein n=1 Tax=Trichonephila clavipes TaxID=2585209 RepID=A0A8X6SIV1_TRICX|nr:hypothetical protein TNCV_1315881 [Trichonephila clavipes]